MPNVLITPHASGHSPHSGRRMFDLLRENLRRQPGSPCSTWWTSASAPEPSSPSLAQPKDIRVAAGVERSLPGSYYPPHWRREGADWRGCEQHDRKDRGAGARGTERLLKSGAALAGAVATGLRARPVAAGGTTGAAPGRRAGRLHRHRGPGGGIHFLRLDRSTGLLTFVETTEAPTDGWITFDPAQRALYAGFRNNRVAGFRLDQSSGRLTAGDVQPTGTGAYPHQRRPHRGTSAGGQLRWGRGGGQPYPGRGAPGEPTQVIPTAGSRGRCCPTRRPARTRSLRPQRALGDRERPGP